MLVRQQNKIKFSIFNFQFSKDGGFTLIELLVVISIVAVLSAILAANFMGMRERARDAQKIQDLNSLKSALRMFYNDYQRYPGDSDDVVYSGLASDIGPSYFPSINNIGYTFAYVRKNNGDGFVLTVELEAGAGNDDVSSQSKCGTGTSTDKIFAVCAN